MYPSLLTVYVPATRDDSLFSQSFLTQLVPSPLFTLYLLHGLAFSVLWTCPVCSSTSTPQPCPTCSVLLCSRPLWAAESGPSASWFPVCFPNGKHWQETEGRGQWCAELTPLTPFWPGCCPLATPLSWESQLRPEIPFHTATLFGFHNHSLHLTVQPQVGNSSPTVADPGLAGVLNPADTVVNSPSFKTTPATLLNYSVWMCHLFPARPLTDTDCTSTSQRAACAPVTIQIMSVPANMPCFP